MQKENVESLEHGVSGAKHGGSGAWLSEWLVYFCFYNAEIAVGCRLKSPDFMPAWGMAMDIYQCRAAASSRTTLVFVPGGYRGDRSRGPPPK
eukprot:792639-Pelagomonas_calceolata.AAC.4